MCYNNVYSQVYSDVPQPNNKVQIIGALEKMWFSTLRGAQGTDLGHSASSMATILEFGLGPGS